MLHAAARSGRTAGWIEVADLRFPYSTKGNHNPGFAEREKYRSARCGDERDIAGMLLINRTGDLHIFTVGRVPMSAFKAAEALQDFCGARSHLVHGFAPMKPVAQGIRLSGLPFTVVGRAHGLDGASLLDDMGARHAAAELLAWLERFRGVASKYLPRYFAYFLAVREQLRTVWLKTFLIKTVWPPLPP